MSLVKRDDHSYSSSHRPLFLRAKLFSRLLKVLPLVLTTTAFTTNLLLTSPSLATTPIIAELKTVLSISSTTNTLNLNINPTIQGTISTTNTTITVDTNNSTGYNLTISSNDEDTSLNHTTISTPPIPKITSILNPNTTADNFINNAWGYSLDNTNYNPIPKLSSPITIKTTNNPTTNDTTTLHLAAKVDSTLPSGSYTDTLIISATASPAPASNFNYLPTLTSLQDPNLKTACTNTYTPPASATTTSTNFLMNTDQVPEAELTDIRDNKTYIIRKLADGKCWMTQNLDLDLDTATALTNETTDLNSKSSWTPQNSTQTSAGIVWGNGSWPQNNEQASSSARSCNPGNIYYTGTGSPQSSSPSGPRYTHIGNYYNWYAATAGSGTYSMTTAGQEAQDSICPKGWKLPYGNNGTSYSTTGDYRTLTNTYGVTSSGSYAYGNSDLALLSSPLHFVRSGYYHYSNGQVDYQGSYGYVWSSSVYDQHYAYYLSFDSGSVGPQNFNYKGHGFSVRCLAR